MTRMFVDIRHAVRSLCKYPAYTAVAVATLALGIGGATAIFSLVHGVLLKPLPYPNADRLVVIFESIPELRDRYPFLPVNAGHLDAWRKAAKSFENLALFTWDKGTLTGAGDPVQLTVAKVSASYFSALGIEPALGRGFTADEDRPGHEGVLVVTGQFWRNQLNYDPQVLGRKLLIDGKPKEIVGVLPPEFRFPEVHRGMQFGTAPGEVGLFTPVAVETKSLQAGEFNYGALGRLTRDVSYQAAETELNVLQERIAKTVNAGIHLTALVEPLHDRVAGQSRGGLLLALGAVGTVLLIACVNIANLALVRSGARRRELAVRAALGAGRFDLVRQPLAESLCLSLTGGILGVAGAFAGLELVVRGGAIDLPRLSEIGVDIPVLAFAVLAAVGSGILCGLAPALKATRSDPQEALRSGGRSATGDASRLPGILSAAEITLSVVLLIGSGLLIHSFLKVMARERGFDIENVATVTIKLAPGKYTNDEDRAAAQRRIIERVMAIPGVRAAGTINQMPLTRENNVNPIVARDAGPIPVFERPMANLRDTSPGYFGALGIALKSGRLFRDGEEIKNPAVISESVARKLWPGQDAVGRELGAGGDELVYSTVVGVVSDVPVGSLERESAMVVYRPYWNRARTDISLALRSAVEPTALAPIVRKAIWEVDPDIPVPEITSMEQHVANSVAPRRLDTLLLSAFAGVSLLLACLGVYGVVAYSVSRRTNEIGVRMALGAHAAQVRWLVLRNGMLPVGIGLFAGVAAAAALTRLLQSMLFEIEPLDLPAFLLGPAVLLAAAVAACLIPARRAARVDPLTALRYE